MIRGALQLASNVVYAVFPHLSHSCTWVLSTCRLGRVVGLSWQVAKTEAYNCYLLVSTEPVPSVMCISATLLTYLLSFAGICFLHLHSDTLVSNY